MCLRLKKALERCGSNQAKLAEYLHVSPATVSQFINHNIWPTSIDVEAMKVSIDRFLQDHGAPMATRVGALTPVKTKGGNPGEVKEPHGNAAPSSTAQNNTQSTYDMEEPMLLRKCNLTKSTKQHFKLFSDPFADDAIQEDADLYVDGEIRYVRETMYQAAKHGGFLAVVGESGAGKTTLMRDLEERILRENQPIRIIRPYVLGLEDHEERGKPLRSVHIAEAIMAEISPRAHVKQSPEARFQQLHECLKQSHASGHRHVLVIDEAHGLPMATLKHLKRFFELESGFKKLLAIILIGQPELAKKLDERNPEVREVVQRCELIELLPLTHEGLGQYLAFKFGRVDKTVAEVIDQNGVAAMAARLTVATSDRNRTERSLLYPLAVGNLLKSAMNMAAEIGAPVVTADVVKGV